MIKKDEAKRAFHQMFGDWANETGLLPPYGNNFIDFYNFKNWVNEKGYSHYFDFRTSGSSENCVERWFDANFKQISRG